MRKITVLLLCFVPFMLMAHVIDWKKDGEYFYTVSPNGRYYAGAVDASDAYFYDAIDHRSIIVSPVDTRGYKVSSINNQGQVAGAIEMQAAIWEQGNKWSVLPLPEDATEDEKMWYEATGISDEGKYIVGYLGEWASRMVLWTLQEDGTYTVEVLPVPDKDPIYKSKPQLIQPRNISDDGSRFLVRCVNASGHVHFPMIYTRQEDNSWSYKFINSNFVIKDGVELPEYKEEMTCDELQEYVEKINEAESGYYPRLDGALMSSNGKYIATKVGYQPKGADYGVFYGAVYDVDNDTTIVFSNLENSSCMSVDNFGNVALGTPATEYFRWSFISNVSTPEKMQTLTEWTKEKTDGTIDLSKYMMYQINEDGTKDLAEGTTYLASEGTAYLTYQTNLLETGLTESFFVLMGEETSVDKIEYEELVVYPNPTNGILNVSGNITNVAIFDVVGRKVYAQGVVENVIDLSYLSKGNYYIIANKDGKMVKTSVIIL